jgi:hypothetical protein
MTKGVFVGMDLFLILNNFDIRPGCFIIHLFLALLDSAQTRALLGFSSELSSIRYLLILLLFKQIVILIV